MRLIDAEKVDFKEVFGGESDFAKDAREAAQKLINQQPKVEAIPVVHGKWKNVGNLGMCVVYKCTCCGARRIDGLTSQYCPDCGAKMDKNL
ncbi:MAG: hypothetical protein ACI4EY_10195 [Lachnospiraceae bacterium]